MGMADVIPGVAMGAAPLSSLAVVSIAQDVFAQESAYS